MATKVHPVQAKTKPSKANQPITQITQAELIEFISIDNQLAKLEKEYKAKSDNLKNLLAANVPVEPGVHIAEATITQRRNPKWKEEAIALADRVFGAGEGEPWAVKITEATEATNAVKLTVR